MAGATAGIGKIVYGWRSLVPCSALAVIELIESTEISLRGARCVCVGASNIVGKPVAVLLMRARAALAGEKDRRISGHNSSEAKDRSTGKGE